MYHIQEHNLLKKKKKKPYKNTKIYMENSSSLKKNATGPTLNGFTIL